MNFPYNTSSDDICFIKSEKVIELAALSTEPSVSKLIYTITKLPAKGSLKQASGKEITSTPFKLGSSTASQTSTVIFSADYSSGSAVHAMVSKTCH